MGVYLWTPIRKPGAYGYYTFDDQNANQITDISGNNRNLTGGTMPSYTLVALDNYAGNYTNVSSGVAPSVSISDLGGAFTMLVWVKPTASSQSYVNCIYGENTGVSSHQISLIWNYNSGQFEYYDDKVTSGTPSTKRATIMSGVSTNTWNLIGYTFNEGAVQTYANGTASSNITGNISPLSKTFRLGSSNLGDRFKGQIGECCMYNGIKTAEEIAEYYNGSKKNYGIS